VHGEKKTMASPKVLTSTECKKPIWFFFWVLVVIGAVAIICGYYDEICVWLNQKLHIIQSSLMALGIRR
jgi:hypothetical protein